MSLSVYNQQLATLKRHLANAKTDRVRAVLISQMNFIKREIAQINSAHAMEYHKSIEEKYTNVDSEEQQSEEQTSKRGRKKKETVWYNLN